HYTAAYEILSRPNNSYRDHGFSIHVYGPEDTAVSFVVDNEQQHGRRRLPCTQMLEIRHNMPPPRTGTASTDSSDT
ncbi:hypothetical protein, partial [Acinetobacter baumannii]|uniref:hypothetical protein n=1 Tax=Acinetobacter baumannii TaxID=470 RepID=UPI00312C70B6